MISCYGLVFARLATVCRPTIVCLGSGHPEAYTAFIIMMMMMMMMMMLCKVKLSVCTVSESNTGRVA